MQEKYSLIELQNKTSQEVFIVGGFLRNFFAGLGETDIDIAGAVEAKELNLPKEYLVMVVQEKLKTAIIKTPNGDKYEYTPFRIESYGIAGEHTPSEVEFTDDISIDAKRRDFACNSIYYSLKRQEFIDPLGGIEDAKSKIVRAKDAERILKDDGLRLMRLCRIVAETGFSIDKNTAEAARKNANLLKAISKERIRDELDRILIADKKYGVENAHYRGVVFLDKQKLFPIIFPDANFCEKDFLSVKRAEPDIRLAAMLFRLELEVKGRERLDTKHRPLITEEPEADDSFCEERSDKAIQKKMTEVKVVLRSLKYPNKTIDEVSTIIEAAYKFLEKPNKKEFRLLVARKLDYIEKIAGLIKAATGDRKTYDNILKEKQMLIKKNVPTKIKDLKIDGKDLMLLGFSGKQIGDILEKLLEECILEPKLNTREKLKEVIASII